ncbi:MAG: ABC transporter ATP-binding protein, partial [Bacillota bacterium]|nr:ABC transporter ATP-binding protein [Bacillota bacterium]
GLEDAKHKSAGAYSKGMKQRLVFARSIINKPKILFLDEPTSGLDPATAQKIKNIIKSKQLEGVTIFLTTHNMQAADELCDIVAFINDGEIVAMDSPRNLKLKYGEKSLRIEYREDGRLKNQLLFLDNLADRQIAAEFLQSGKVETVHSQEATLEQIFIKLTGRGLS